jgi:hypothetical protein
MNNISKAIFWGMVILTIGAIAVSKNMSILILAIPSLLIVFIVGKLQRK